MTIQSCILAAGLAKQAGDNAAVEAKENTNRPSRKTKLSGKVLSIVLAPFLQLVFSQKQLSFTKRMRVASVLAW
jgi:ubiquinone biosynthesis protein UbiJ